MRPAGRFFVPQKPKETLLSLQAVSLEDLGWDAFFQEAFQPYENDNLIPARVAARHHGPCELLTELGRLGGVPAGRLAEDELPAGGGRVAVRAPGGGEKAVVAGGGPPPAAGRRQGGGGADGGPGGGAGR